MYPDSSNMPYLTLNKAAAKAFTHEYHAIAVTPEDTVILTANGTERKAIICGVFDDGSENPAAYMSYDVAQKEYSTGGQTELVFLLNNMGNAEDVVSALQRKNIYARFDSNLTLAWKLLQTQCWQTALLSVGLLICAISLVLEKRSAELVKAQQETAMLLLAGMTVDYVRKIYQLRIVLMGTACSLVAALMALLLGVI